VLIKSLSNNLRSSNTSKGSHLRTFFVYVCLNYKQNMKFLIIIIAFLSLKNSIAQSDSIIKQFDTRKNNLNKNGMIVLSSWAGANIVSSSIGYALTTSNEEKEFHLMNGSWGIINLGIALPGLLVKKKTSATMYDLQKSQTKIEKLFLANTILDVAYISGGFYLKEYSKNHTDIKKQERFNGFGNSIILQGAGLMVFDMVMTILNNRHRKKHLDPFLKKTSISFTGTNLRLGYRFN
jgi:hypothetical protein